ncbi:HAD-IIA family hydrolase [candidate division KSB1 bacterium]
MIKNFLIDIEGTIIKDKTFVPVTGVPRWFKTIRQEGISFVLASNNTTHSPDELRKALNNNGFDFKEYELITCLSIAVDELKVNKCEKCFVLASDSVKEFLKSGGFNVIESDNADAVIVGLDLEIDYNRFKTAVEALLKGASFIALHKNRLYRDIDGKFSISAGGIAAALEYTTKRDAEVIGKPSEKFYQKALKKLGSAVEDTLFISDDPFSDLKGAKNAGLKTCFVLSGKYRSKDVLKELPVEYYPDIIIKDITELL